MKLQDDKIAFYAATLSFTEIGLGSALHAFHIPFTGQFLSLNQIAILSSAAESFPKNEKNFASSISSIAALLKSLAPIGKKLTPMLAITMQGLLYTVGILLFGNTLAGRLLGAALSSLWSFIQPAIIYTIIFGDNIWKAIAALNKNLPTLPFIPSFIPEGFFTYLIFSAIALKVVVAMCISVYIPGFLRIKASASPSKEANPSQKTAPTSWRKIIVLSFKDLFKPLFLLSLSLVALLFYFIETPPDWLYIALFRPIACGFLFFITLRVFPIERIVDRIVRKDSAFSRSFKAAIGIVKIYVRSPD
jgi:hypothetical protein